MPRTAVKAKPWETVGPRHWRWRGYRRWHRWALGPLCVSFYVYPREEGLRPFITHSWRRVDANGEGWHSPTFRRWLKARRSIAPAPASPGGGVEGVMAGGPMAEAWRDDHGDPDGPALNPAWQAEHARLLAENDVLRRALRLACRDSSSDVDGWIDFYITKATVERAIAPAPSPSGSDPQ